MPSSLLFAGLVGTWLVVFVPMAARNRRPMKLTSDVALSSRVLERPVRTRAHAEAAGRMVEEVGEEVGMDGSASTRYRPGRGGYDPEAAELAARARYTFRQRVVLTLVLLAAAGAAVAVGLKVPEAWWVHGGAAGCLVLYLVHLRRQVRSEQQIRARRAARSAGIRRGTERGAYGRAAADPSTTPGRVIERGARRSRSSRAVATKATDPEPAVDELDELSAHLRDAPADGEPDTGADAGPDPTDAPVDAEDEPDAEPADRGGRTSALPLLEPVPLPVLPAGTHRLELDDEDPELHYLDNPDERWGYRRAAGQ